MTKITAGKINEKKYFIRRSGGPKTPGAANGKAEDRKEAQAEELPASLAGEHDKQNIIGGYVEEGKYGAW